MTLRDHQRFECAYHLVIAAQYDGLQQALRAVELSLKELMTILHRIEFDGATRLFTIRGDRLVLTPEGKERVQTWSEALRLLGITI